jgi:hypothetical protein
MRLVIFEAFYFQLFKHQRSFFKMRNEAAKSGVPNKLNLFLKKCNEGQSNMANGLRWSVGFHCSSILIKEFDEKEQHSLPRSVVVSNYLCVFI